MRAVHLGLVAFVFLLVGVFGMLVVEFAKAEEDIRRVGGVGRILPDEPGKVCDREFAAGALFDAAGVDAVVVEGNDAVPLALVLVLGEFKHAFVVVGHLFGVGPKGLFEAG